MAVIHVTIAIGTMPSLPIALLASYADDDGQTHSMSFCDCRPWILLKML